jgi:hypothetical protein
MFPSRGEHPAKMIAADEINIKPMVEKKQQSAPLRRMTSMLGSRSVR